MGLVVKDLKPKAVLYLDVDGTVRHGKDELGRFVNKATDVKIFPAAIERMHEWIGKGGLICGVTNQGGVALRHVSVMDMVHALLETNRLTGWAFSAIHVCPHHPEAEDPLEAHCWCRKPHPGAIITARSELTAQRGGSEQYPPHLAVMVGDRPEDQAAAEACGIKFAWAKDWRAHGVDYPL